MCASLYTFLCRSRSLGLSRYLCVSSMSLSLSVPLYLSMFHSVCFGLSMSHPVCFSISSTFSLSALSTTDVHSCILHISSTQKHMLTCQRAVRRTALLLLQTHARLDYPDGVGEHESASAGCRCGSQMLSVGQRCVVDVLLLHPPLDKAIAEEIRAPRQRIAHLGEKKRRRNGEQSRA